MNIILVVSDTFRRDHLPCYGNRTVHAPAFSAFAERGLVFEDCRAASFPTVPCRADLMTGRYTFAYKDWGPLGVEEQTLAHALSTGGYLTCGIVDTPFFVRNGYGFDRGFHDFQWIRGQRQGPERDDVQLRWRAEEDRFAASTFSAATDWLERHHRERFFLYVDTWDPHEPWDPPAHYVRRYLPDYAGEQVGPSYWDWKERGLTQRDLDVAHACYMGEISMVDAAFGALIARLDALGIADDTAVFFTSDHGYYFGEHGQLGKTRFRWEGDVPFEEGWIRGIKIGYVHRSPLHNEVTRVPLLARIPGVTPRRVSGLVSLPDLMPTILELAGVQPPPRVLASSLMPLIQGRTTKVHDFVVTSAALHDPGEVSRMVDDQVREIVEGSPSTITDGEWDLLYSTNDEPVELYRTVEDPGHARNVFAEHRAVAERLHAAFRDWLTRVGAPPSAVAARQRLPRAGGGAA